MVPNVTVVPVNGYEKFDLDYNICERKGTRRKATVIIHNVRTSRYKKMTLTEGNETAHPARPR